MSNQVSIRSYSETNDNTNCMVVSIGETDLYFSYQTIIAFSTVKHGLVARVNEWSTTTGKHLNWVDGGDKSNRIDGETFESMINDVMENGV